MMQQYMEIKEHHQDSILFFRLGDFYEMFFDDALTASRVLEITLTGKNCGLEERAPMCGVPYHSSNGYISKLVEKGYKVAICEQVEPPSSAGIVKREVVRVITPGTVIDNSMLDEKQNNYLSSVTVLKNSCSISYVDVSTGNMLSTEFKDPINDKNIIDLYNEICKVNPSEILSNRNLEEIFSAHKLNSLDTVLKNLNIIDQGTDTDYYLNMIKDHFKVISTEVFGIYPEDRASILSIGNLLEYLYSTQKISLDHINQLACYKTDDYMIIDNSTRKNLELTEPLRGTDKKNTVFNVIDYTKTAMGARKLKKWLLEPLQDIASINCRHDAVEVLYNNIIVSNNIREHMKRIYDIERLMSKITYGNCNARDLNSLNQSIEVLPDLKCDISTLDAKLFNEISKNMDTLLDVHEMIATSIIENPPVTIKEGNLIRDGYNEELDELRNISVNGKEWLNGLIDQEREKTGIKNLKIGFNKVFGYYIEVTKSYLNLVPEDYIRKQTLANAERYITPDLKDMEAKILNAESKIVELEYEIFNDIRLFVKNQIERIQQSAEMISTVDALNSLCTAALKNSYIRPEMSVDGIVNIVNGRHPVIEKVLKDERFIENSTYLDKDENRFSIITGPNMAGKSTYMRQVALITILAHIGSFVPAEKAQISLVDKLFSRVGASDDLSSGQSTFMVEMSEVSNIINNATENSLIILDEIGRGTSTYDGLSIAWSVTEYITNNIMAKTLFATHYHELSELEDKIKGINNYKIMIKESGEDIIFLRKITKGSIDKSYGIQVARLAGLPKNVINRSFELLEKLEEIDLNKKNSLNLSDTKIKNEIPVSTDENREQVSFWNYDAKYKDFISENILNLNINSMTPLDSLNLMNELIKKARELGD
ncbi:DNA mismatch repair protein MutS [Dethiosulfatibacter aminovorans]|nr:DNA mismatch repair protein MutS [Dethiosulfatibacter aminovorans]